MCPYPLVGTSGHIVEADTALVKSLGQIIDKSFNLLTKQMIMSDERTKRDAEGR